MTRPISSVPGVTYTEHPIALWGISLRLTGTRNVKRLLRPTVRNELTAKRVSRWAIRRLVHQRRALGVGFVPVSDIDIKISDDPARPFGSLLTVKILIINDPDGSLKARFGGRLRATGSEPVIWIAHEAPVH